MSPVCFATLNKVGKPNIGLINEAPVKKGLAFLSAFKFFKKLVPVSFLNLVGTSTSGSGSPNTS